MAHVGAKIKEKMTQMGVKNVELAQKLGVTPSQIGKTLKKESITTEYLERIMTALGMKSWEIFGEEPSHSYEIGIVSEREGNYSLDDLKPTLAACEEKVKSLELLLQEKERLLEEKERFIQVLLQKKA